MQGLPRCNPRATSGWRRASPKAEASCRSVLCFDTAAGGFGCTNAGAETGRLGMARTWVCDGANRVGVLSDTPLGGRHREPVTGE
jgi:hypothetical protein